MRVIHPHIKNLLAYILKKINFKAVKTFIIILSIFMAIDCVISAYAINLFTIRMIANNDLNVANKTTIIEINNRLEKNKFSKKLSNTLFNDNIMLKTYPNLKVQEINGSMVYFKDLLPNIKPYYIRFQDKDFYK